MTAEVEFPRLREALARIRAEDEENERESENWRKREEEIREAQRRREEDYSFLKDSEVTRLLQAAGKLLEEYYRKRYSGDRGKVSLSVTNISEHRVGEVNLKLVWDLHEERQSLQSGEGRVRDCWQEVVVSTQRNKESKAIEGLCFLRFPWGMPGVTTMLSRQSIIKGVDYAVSNPIRRSGDFNNEHEPYNREEIPLS